MSVFFLGRHPGATPFDVNKQKQKKSISQKVQSFIILNKCLSTMRFHEIYK